MVLDQPEKVTPAFLLFRKGFGRKTLVFEATSSVLGWRDNVTGRELCASTKKPHKEGQHVTSPKGTSFWSQDRSRRLKVPCSIHGYGTSKFTSSISSTFSPFFFNVWGNLKRQQPKQRYILLVPIQKFASLWGSNRNCSFNMQRVPLGHKRG